MLVELTELGFQIGNRDGEGDIQEAFKELVAALAKQTRPDAERAALMLLSAGNMLYGNVQHAADDCASEAWKTAAAEADHLLGIVPMTAVM